MSTKTIKNRNHLKKYWPLTTTLIAVFGSFCITTGLYFSVQGQEELNKKLIHNADELRVLSAQLPGLTNSASSGSVNAFDMLQATLNTMTLHTQTLFRTPLSLFPLEDQQASQQIKSLKSTWQTVQEDVAKTLGLKETILSITNSLSTIKDNIPILQLEYDDVVESLLTTGATAEQVAMAQRQSWLAEKILTDSQKTLSPSSGLTNITEDLSRNISLFTQILTATSEGSTKMGIKPITSEAARDRLNEIRNVFQIIQSGVQNILQRAPNLTKLTETSEQIQINSNQLLQQASVFMKTINQSAPLSLIKLLLIASVALSFIFAALTLSVIRLSAHKKIMFLRRLHHNQNASMKQLADKITAIAKGDLTVKANSGLNINKNIAESINFSAEQITSLVKTIANTATKIDTVAQNAHHSAQNIAKTAEKQNSEISNTTRSLHKMAQTIEQTATNTSNSAIMAKRSIKLSVSCYKSAQATTISIKKTQKSAQHTLESLNNLRDSSQNIENFLAVIRGITEQTKVLSLNATIQASMSNSSGKNFSGVIDEIQRLSERLSSAKNDVEKIALTIKKDSLQAINAMQHTSTDIMNSLQLTANSQTTSEKLEQASHHLFDIIKNISLTLNTQTQETHSLTEKIKSIKLTSMKDKGDQTIESASDLTAMASEMKKFVSQFNIPNTKEKETENV